MSDKSNCIETMKLLYLSLNRGNEDITDLNKRFVIEKFIKLKDCEKYISSPHIETTSLCLLDKLANKNTISSVGETLNIIQKLKETDEEQYNNNICSTYDGWKGTMFDSINTDLRRNDLFSWIRYKLS